MFHVSRIALLHVCLVQTAASSNNNKGYFYSSYLLDQIQALVLEQHACAA